MFLSDIERGVIVSAAVVLYLLLCIRHAYIVNCSLAVFNIHFLDTV